MRRFVLGVCAASLLTGCSETVVLRDGSDGLALAYECDAVEAQARSSAERALLRMYSVELLRDQGPSNRKELQAVMAAYDEGDWPRFERLVVDQLCANRSVVDRIRVTLLPDLQGPPDRGDAAPSFALPVLSHGALGGSADSLSMSDLLGRHVVLAFWSTWCPPCMVEYPELLALDRDLRDRGLSIIGVLHRDTPSNALEYLATFGAGTFPTVVDDGTLARAYGLYGIPLTIVIDPAGVIVERGVGWSPGKGDELGRHLSDLLSEPSRPPEAQ